MPQLGFLAWEEGILARWMVGAMPTGELYGRLHFGPMADKLITGRPANGRPSQLVARADILSQPGLELRMFGVPAGKTSAWVSDGAGSMDPMAPIGLLQTAGPTVGVSGQSGQQQFLAQVAIPMSAMNNSRRKLRVYYVIGDSGATDTTTVQLFLGAAGNGTDNQVYTSGAIPGSQRSADALIEIQRITATSVQVWQRLWTASTTVIPAQVALTSSLDTVDQYLTLALKMGGNTDTPTLVDLRVELH